MSRVIADGLSKKATATTQEAEAGTPDKYPDAAGVHAAFNQYGLGYSPDFVGDLNNLVASGSYKCYYPDVLNPPIDADTLDAGYVTVQSGTPKDFISQTWLSTRKTSAGKAWVRYFNPVDGWQSWAPLYTAYNILGTVSQSAGVPTGAVIERGSNANGEYVKFADGTMICDSLETLPANSTDTQEGSTGFFYKSGGDTWSFPAEFVNTDYQIFGVLAGGQARFMTGIGGTKTTLSVGLRVYISVNSQIYRPTPIAIGRWF